MCSLKRFCHTDAQVVPSKQNQSARWAARIETADELVGPLQNQLAPKTKKTAAREKKQEFHIIIASASVTLQGHPTATSTTVLIHCGARRLRFVDRLRGCHVDQVSAPPSHPLSVVAWTRHDAIAHLVGSYVRIVGEDKGRVVAVNPLEHNVLLTLLATVHQLLLLAAGPVVHTGLCLAHNLHVETRVQHPTACARADGGLHSRKKISAWLEITSKLA